MPRVQSGPAPYSWRRALAWAGLGPRPAAPVPEEGRIRRCYVFFSSATSAVSIFFASPNSIRLLSL